MTKKRALILIAAAFLAIAAAVICQFGSVKGEWNTDYHPTYFSYDTLGELSLNSDAIFIGTAGEVRANQSINVGIRYPLCLDYTVASVHVTKALKGDIVNSTDLSRHYGLDQMPISELSGQIETAEQAMTQDLISLQGGSDEFSLTERELKIIAVKEKWLEELNLLEERAKADGTFESREYWREYQQKIDELMERLEQIPE